MPLLRVSTMPWRKYFDMNIQVTEEDPKSWHSAASKEPMLWEDNSLSEYLGQCLWLVARKKNIVVGTWLVPTVQTESGLIAQRPFRALPYCAPRIFNETTFGRRMVMSSFFQYLKRTCIAVELPLSPFCYDFGAITSQGGFLEARHSSVMETDYCFAKSASKMSKRNRDFATKNLLVSEIEASMFDFQMAIVGASPQTLDARQAFASRCSHMGKSLFLEARYEGQSVGQCCALYGNSYAILAHLWTHKCKEAKGAANFLVEDMSRRCFENLGIVRLDLGGSILAGVDRFMTDFGCKLQPYAIIYWHQERQRILSMVNEALKIPGRNFSYE